MTNDPLTLLPCVLTIGGTDPSGGAGLPADARACAAFGAHALPIVTAVVAQNTCGVRTFAPVSSDLLAAQLDYLLEDCPVHAVKTGLLPDALSIRIVAARLKNLKVPLIIDPVLAPSSGPSFSSQETIEALCELLLPLAELVTPNWPEAERLLGEPFVDSAWAAHALQERRGPDTVLLKGGHAPQNGENQNQAIDIWWDGAQVHEFRAPRLHGYEVRGTGCQLASAIAAQRAQNVALSDAIPTAKHWLTQQIQTAVPLGQGRRVTIGRIQEPGVRIQKLESDTADQGQLTGD